MYQNTDAKIRRTWPCFLYKETRLSAAQRVGATETSSSSLGLAVTAVTLKHLKHLSPAL